MAVSIEKLKLELTGYLYKRIPNLPISGSMMASWYYSTAGKNITEILKKADSDVRYASMKESLTSEQITLPHYAILYNDIEILQCAMEGFKSEQKYDVLKQKMCHGSTSTFEFIIEVLAGLKKSSSVEIETL